ncbi:MAG: glycosyltransferase family 4 protein [Herpetosiphon sp.]
MRVLLLSKAMVVGAYQRKAEELAAIPGVDLTVAVPPSWREPRVGTLELERRHLSGYRLAVLPIWFNGHFHIHCYPGLKRLITAIRPDILHIDEESFNLATLHAMYLGRAAGARCCFYNYANIERRYPPPWSLFEHYNLSHAHAAMVANHEAGTILRGHGYNGPMHHVSQFGVDPELFFPTPTLPVEPFRVGYIGRLVPEKGVLDLVTAMAQLPPAMHLTIIGRGAQEPAIRSLIDRLSLSERVTITPHLPSGEIPAALRQLHALALPSHTTPRWKEQFGRVLVEAMASGVPPVGSDSGEIPHVIDDAGLVFPEGDIVALAAALRRLWEYPELRQELANRGRHRVLQNYTQRAVAAQCVSIYQTMLAQPAAHAVRKTKHR